MKTVLYYFRAVGNTLRTALKFSDGSLRYIQCMSFQCIALSVVVLAGSSQEVCRPFSPRDKRPLHIWWQASHQHWWWWLLVSWHIWWSEYTQDLKVKQLFLTQCTDVQASVNIEPQNLDRSKAYLHVYTRLQGGRVKNVCTVSANQQFCQWLNQFSRVATLLPPDVKPLMLVIMHLLDSLKHQLVISRLFAMCSDRQLESCQKYLIWQCVINFLKQLCDFKQ